MEDKTPNWDEIAQRLGEASLAVKDFRLSPEERAAAQAEINAIDAELSQINEG